MRTTDDTQAQELMEQEQTHAQAQEPQNSATPPAMEDGPSQAHPTGQGLFEESPMTQRWQNRQEERRIRQEERRAKQEQEVRERRQAKAEAQAAHQARQQEKQEAQQAQWNQHQAERQQRQLEESPRRLGTLTLGLALVAAGTVMLFWLLFPGQDLRWLGWLAPAILILLGAEVLVRYALAKERRLRYDLLGGLLTMALVVVCLAVGSSHYWMPYISPARHQAEQRLQGALEERIYEALKDQPQIGNLRVYAYAQPTVTAAGGVLGEYAITDASLHVTLIGSYDSKEAFGADCYRVMQQLTQLDGLNRVTFEDSLPEERERYRLSLQGKFQRQMGEAAMVSQVEVQTPYQPQPELPQGDYWALVDGYGQQEVDSWLAQLAGQRRDYLAASQPPEGEQDFSALEELAPAEPAAP